MATGSRCLYIMDDGTTKGCGFNSQGQLGLGNTNTITTPVSGVLSNVKQISMGLYHTMYLLEDGTVKATGYNNYGQIGISGAASVVTPGTVLSGVKQVTCGVYHTFFLMEDGTAKVTGYNNYGQHATGGKTQQYTPYTVSISGVKEISCGDYHTMFLMEDGTVRGAGRNHYGQLGIGNVTDYSNSGGVLIPITGVKKIICGQYHTIFLMEDGTIKSCGYNAQGQLGTEDNMTYKSPTDIGVSGVKQVTCGENHTIIMLEDGTIKGCGLNSQGQLGLGNTISYNTFQNIDVTGVKQIFGYDKFSVFLMNDGTIKICGENDLGQLGIGANTSNQTSLVNVSITNVKTLVDYISFIILKYLFQDGTDIKYYNGIWDVAGSAPVTKTMFDAYGMENLSELDKTKLEELSEVKLLTWTNEEASNLSYNAVPSAQIAFPTGDINVSSIENVDSMNLTTNKSVNGDIKIIVSVDLGNTWNTWSDGWVNIDETDLSLVKANGITPEILNTLTSENWNSLINGISTLRFAYYLDINDVNDIASTDKFDITVDMKGSWDKAIHGTDYNYGYTNNTTLSVKLLTDGDYKINYGDSNEGLDGGEF